MASWRRNKQGHVLVYSYYHNGKQLDRPKQLPRSQTKHLDAEQEESNIDYWVKNWAQKNERGHTEESIDYSDSGLNKYLGRFCSYLESIGRDKATIAQHKRLLKKYAFQFFLKQSPPLADPNSWPGASIRLISYLEDENKGAPTIKRTNISLRLFYDWMAEEGIIHNGVKLKLRNPRQVKKPTPLKFTLTPDDVLSWAKRCELKDVKLMGLIGFFFALRPQETFALKKTDFRAGSTVAINLDIAKIMIEAGLYSRLAVHITKQRGADRSLKEPKGYSRGWVCCFNEEAAKKIVELLKNYEEEKPVFSYDNRESYRRWKKHGIAGITLKDLRRASLYFLGHYSGLGEKPINLMKFARHKEIETTMLYVRQPDQDLEDFKGDLDLSA